MNNLPPSNSIVLSGNDQPSQLVKRTRLASIAKNSAMMLAGQILIKGLSFLFSVFVVRKLGASDFGVYSSIMASAFLVAMLTDLGMSTLATREMARNEVNSRWMVPNIMVLRAILSVFVISGNVVVARLLGKPPHIVFGIFIASLGLLLYAFQGPLDSLLIARERLYYSSMLNVLNQMTFVLLGTIALLTGRGYLGLLVSTLMGVFFMGIASVYIVVKVMGEKFFYPDVRRWWEIIRGGIPFGIIGLIVEFTARFDTVFMSYILTYSVVGFFNVSLNLILTVLLVAQSLALALFPVMVKEYDSGRGSIQDTMQRAMRYLLLISLPIAIGGMVIADRLIPVLYGEGYQGVIPLFRIMVWALPFMFLAEILGRASIVMHLERKVALYIAVNAVISIILSITLIPRIGVIGAAIITVINRFNSVLLSILILGPSMVFKQNIKPLVRVLITGLIMGLGVSLLGQMTFIKQAHDVLALVVLVGSGGILYVILGFLFKAVSPGEAQYLYEVVQRRMRRVKIF